MEGNSGCNDCLSRQAFDNFKEQVEAVPPVSRLLTSPERNNKRALLGVLHILEPIAQSCPNNQAATGDCPLAKGINSLPPPHANLFDYYSFFLSITPQ